MNFKQMHQYNYRLPELLTNYLHLIHSTSEPRMCHAMKKGEIHDYCISHYYIFYSNFNNLATKRIRYRISAVIGALFSYRYWSSECLRYIRSDKYSLECHTYLCRSYPYFINP